MDEIETGGLRDDPARQTDDRESSVNARELTDRDKRAVHAAVNVVFTVGKLIRWTWNVFLHGGIIGAIAGAITAWWLSRHTP